MTSISGRLNHDDASVSRSGDGISIAARHSQPPLRMLLLFTLSFPTMDLEHESHH
ncbi:hypothetical protein RB5555 [Rhodopirellula baltica SH 1]|uniref:Uncharacterized protein n=1 Tax=Rhodopirellula baltica (strain DSM 10527 / NCIMB 13988 / SH1) TaxID=243090 RepID=Q7URN3_RHOBA|nr:hypothetical protein RB5555 [Rhodopirellula baltica SH 1]